jgi:methylglutaconyl-CoA hydratase
MPVVIVEKRTPQLTVLTLNRPERRNSLSVQLLSELVAAIRMASDQAEERILILRGAGAAFCTGLDLKEASDHAKAHATADLVAQTLITLAETRLVTIAAVHGAAVAGGAGIMSACDYVVAAAGTKIGYPETRRGLVAGLVMTFLRRQVREREIRELLFSAELIDAERAREIGLVNKVVPTEAEAIADAEAFAEKVMQGAPAAVHQTKRLIEEFYGRSFKSDIELALKHHMEARTSAEAREGIAAFNEKRPPKWTK